MKLFQILSSPIPLFAFIVVVAVILMGVRRRSRLPEIDRFGLNRNEQTWLSSHQMNSWLDIFGFLTAIVLAFFLAEKGQFSGVLLIIFTSFWFQHQRGRKVVQKLLDYINKLEQKK